MKVPLMHKGRLHGHVVSKLERDGKEDIMELDVHLDMETGRLMDSCTIEKQGDHYELVDKNTRLQPKHKRFMSNKICRCDCECDILMSTVEDVCSLCVSGIHDKEYTK